MPTPTHPNSATHPARAITPASAPDAGASSLATPPIASTFWLARASSRAGITSVFGRRAVSGGIRGSEKKFNEWR